MTQLERGSEGKSPERMFAIYVSNSRIDTLFSLNDIQAVASVLEIICQVAIIKNSGYPFLRPNDCSPISEKKSYFT